MFINSNFIGLDSKHEAKFFHLAVFYHGTCTIDFDEIDQAAEQYKHMSR